MWGTKVTESWKIAVRKNKIKFPIRFLLCATYVHVSISIAIRHKNIRNVYNAKIIYVSDANSKKEH